MLPSQIRAKEAAKKAAAGQGGVDTSETTAAPAPNNTSKPVPSPARKSWNEPKPQEAEDLGWSSSDDDTPAPAPAAKAKVAAPKPKAKVVQPAAPAAPARNVSQPPAEEPVKAVSVKDRIKNMEAAPAPAPVKAEAEAEAPKRMSVKDRIKQAEAVGASGEDAEEPVMGEVVTKTQGAHKAAKAMTRTTKLAAKSNAGNEEMSVPAMFEGKFKNEDVEAYRRAFKDFDANGNGEIEQAELSNVLKNLGMPIQKSEVAGFIAEFDLDKSGAISFGEFLHVMEKAQRGLIGGKASEMVRTIQKGVDIQKVHGVGGGYHSYTEEEKRFYASFINAQLAGDADCAHIVPISLDGEDLFASVNDGVLSCKMVNIAFPGTIDERVIDKKPKNVFQKNQNQTLALNAARSIGCQFVGIGAMDLINGEPHLVLALLWQLIKAAVLSHISLAEHPYLVRLLTGDETIATLMKLPPEKILLRWVNYIMGQVGSSRKIKNFGQDVKDSEVYSRLMKHVSDYYKVGQEHCTLDALEQDDLSVRAAAVLRAAAAVDINAAMTATDIFKGNTKMNLLFVAELFNKYPCLAPLTQEETAEVEATATEMLDFNDEGTREERVFRLWINALNIPDVFVSDLFQDLGDGYILLQVLDQSYKGCVEWKKVVKNPGTMYKRLENCMMAVETAKEIGLKLTGIDAQNISEGTPLYVLAFVWQLWRANLADLMSQAGGDKRPDEKTIVSWMNEKISASGVKLKNFKDPSLATSHSIYHVLTALQPDSVDWSLVTDGTTDEEKKSNAEYAISVARKIGCTIFTLPEDIVAVRPKQIMILVAMLMLVEISTKK